MAANIRNLKAVLTFSSGTITKTIPSKVSHSLICYRYFCEQSKQLAPIVELVIFLLSAIFYNKKDRFEVKTGANPCN